MMYAELIDASVLGLLCDEAGQWHMTELAREYNDEIELHDAVGRLVRGGLAHRTKDDFVFISAAGRYAYAVQQAG